MKQSLTELASAAAGLLLVLSIMLWVGSGIATSEMSAVVDYCNNTMHVNMSDANWGQECNLTVSD